MKFVAHGVAGDGRMYLAMEWLEGEDLASYLDRGARRPFSIAQPRWSAPHRWPSVLLSKNLEAIPENKRTLELAAKY